MEESDLNKKVEILGDIINQYENLQEKTKEIKGLAKSYNNTNDELDGLLSEID